MLAHRAGHAVLRLLISTVLAAAVIALLVHSARSGQMLRWHTYRAAADGFAIDAEVVRTARPEHPVRLRVVQATTLTGPATIRVRRHERVPAGTTGVVTDEMLARGRNVRLESGHLVVERPFGAATTRGTSVREGFRHEGLIPHPLAALWNVGVVFILGLSLGTAAEAVTALCGIRPTPIRHVEERGIPAGNR
jgi:hypothetical protein